MTELAYRPSFFYRAVGSASISEGAPMTDIPPPPPKLPMVVIICFAVAAAVVAGVAYFIARL
jgi:hypothetical protein